MSFVLSFLTVLTFSYLFFTLLHFFKLDFYSFTCSIFTLRFIFFNLPFKFKLHFSFSTCSTFTFGFKFLLDTLVLNNTTLITRIFKKDLNSFTIFVGSEDILEKESRIQRRELVFNFLSVWPNNLFLCLFFDKSAKCKRLGGISKGFSFERLINVFAKRIQRFDCIW